MRPDGTDPKDPLSKSQFLYNLNPPRVQLGALGGQWKLTWDWPAPYADKIKFSVQSLADVTAVFMTLAVTPTHLGVDRFEVVFPTPPSPAQFFRLGMSLK